MATVGNTPQNGVYSLGSYARNYPIILDFTYPISLLDATSEDGFSTNNLEIGAVLVCGTDVFASWYDHDTSTYGVDIIDTSNKLNQAYFVTRLVSVEREKLQTFIKFLVAYCNLPTDTVITIQYSTDYGVTWQNTTETIDVDRQLVSAWESPEGSTIMVKVILTTLGNTAPSIESAGIEIA